MSKRALPPLSKLSELEARAVESMFRVYDYQAKGRIPQHLAYKLMLALGFKFSIHSLPVNASLKDLLLFLDVRVPDPEPALYCQLHSFTNLVQKPVSELAPMADRVDEGLEGDDDAANLSLPDAGSAAPGGGSLVEANGMLGDDQSVGSKATTGSLANRYAGTHELISTQAINEFMEKLGRPPVSKTQCDLLLTSMLDYDDCSENTWGHPAVPPEYFSRDFANFAKKSNALKNFK
jgi:hypothetical protein